MTPLEAVAEAMAVHQRGELELAEQLYDKILEVHPQEPNALHYRGVLRLHQRRHEEGLALIRQSLAIDPGNAHAWNNLGNGLRVSGDREAACAAFEEALRLAPHLHLVSFNLGTLLVRLARHREAIAAFEHAVEGRPDYDDAYENLGRLYYRFNEIDKAHATYLKWLQMAPEHPVALHMAAATAPADARPPARATAEYVRRAFDEFAHRFDENLAGLGYRAPQLVTTALGCQPEALRTAHAILDAGCGTGLCGPLLRPLASRLDGVDLSEKMVELAAERGGYDELIVGELCEVMRSRPRTYDAIVSADTLVYFGDLAEPLTAAAGCLRPDGWLVFTVEVLGAAHAAAGFRLAPSGRYEHSREYLERALQTAGFAVLSLQPEPLRLERKQEVPGWLVCARLRA